MREYYWRSCRDRQEWGRLLLGVLSERCGRREDRRNERKVLLGARVARTGAPKANRRTGREVDFASCDVTGCDVSGGGAIACAIVPFP